MLKYDQPKFYRFNQDSIELVKFSHATLKDFSIHTVLDIGCGCGFMGIEYGLLSDAQVDFLEVQSEFVPYIEENILKFNLTKTNVMNLNILDFNSSKKYDLILFNPPYYVFEKSRKSTNLNKNLCRIIHKADIYKIVNKIKELIQTSCYLAICYPEDNTDYRAAIKDMGLSIVSAITVNRINYLVLKNIESL